MKDSIYSQTYRQNIPMGYYYIIFIFCSHNARSASRDSEIADRQIAAPYLHDNNNNINILNG